MLPSTTIGFPTVRSYVEAYEAIWEQGQRPELKLFLPPRDHPIYCSVLCELICVELEHDFARGQPESLENYRRTYPELMRDPKCWQDVVRYEYRLQSEAGRKPDPEAYRRKYAVEIPSDPAEVDLPQTERTRPQSCINELQNTRQVEASCAPSLQAGSDALRLFDNLFQNCSESSVQPGMASSRMPTPDTDFAGFHLLRELGRGAFSRVFLARQMDLADRLVALKVATGQFQESQTLARLQHTNIVPIYSAHRVGSLQAVCMPYLGATTFADVLVSVRSSGYLPRSGSHFGSTCGAKSTRGQLDTLPEKSGSSKSAFDGPISSPAEFPASDQTSMVSAASQVASWAERLANMSYVDANLTLVAQLADGLSHAHVRGILHRDLKPANILLTDDGEPMLLDFNLSADAGEPGGVEAAAVGGTLPYMAPEHLAAFGGERVVVDARADVYSLGVILFELLTAHHPFPIRRGPTATLLLDMRADRNTPPRVRPLNPDVSPSVEAIVLKCLALDPSRRYQTAAEFREDIQRHLDDLPLRHATNPSWRERARKFRRRNPRLMPATLFLFTAMLLAGAVVLLAREADRRRAEADARGQLELSAAVREFKERSFELNHQLNAIPPDDRQLKDGMDLAEGSLRRFGTFRDDGWLPGAVMDRLAPEERGKLLGSAGEYLLLLAHAATLRADRTAGSDGQGLLLRALALNESAARCYSEASLPRQLWTQRVELLNRLGETERARDAAAEATRTPPRDAWDRYTLARQRVIQGQLREAIPLLQKATREDPGHFWSWFLLGYCHYLTGETSDAIRCYTCCQALRPEFVPPCLERGLAYLAEKKFADAQADFDRVIEANPDLGDAYLNRSLARNGLGDSAGALADLDRVITLGGRHTRAYFLRARIREAGGDRDGARQDREEGLRREPQDVDSYVARGLYRAGKGDPEGALADYQKALELNPRWLPALQNCAVVLTDGLHRPSEAVKCLDRALEIDPNYLPARRGRAVLLARLGRRKEALADLSSALHRDSSPTTRYYAACVFALTSASHPEDRVAAINHLRAALAGGFGPDFFEKDDDLKHVREAPEFRSIVTAVWTLRNKP